MPGQFTVSSRGGGGSGRGEGAADTAREIQINGKNKKNVEALRIVKTQ